MLNLPIVGNGNGNDTSVTRRFGVFEVDLRAGELRRGGVKVKIQEQPFQVLAELLERPGQVVTREELQKRLWQADTYVDFDHSLNAAIRRLRDALGDSAENPTFVETVARRGYRFLAPVTVAGNGTPTIADTTVVPPAPARRQVRWWITAGVAGLVLVLIGLAAGFLLAPRAPVPDRVTLLTRNPVNDPVRAAAISRDGRYLAYSDDTGFYLLQIDTGETHPITLPDGMCATGISWFPDSVHMALALSGESASGSSLWEVSALSGGARRIVDDGHSPAVSPTGNQVAYIAGKPMRERIWITGVTGEPPRELVGNDGDLFGRIAWSPDGKRIAYTTAKFTYGYGATGMIEVADVSSNHAAARSVLPTILVSVFGLDAPLAWAPDGRLIYTREEDRPSQADSNLWWIRLNSRVQPDGAPVRLTKDQGAVLGITMSGDGKRIAYVKGVPQPDVYVARVEDSGGLEEPRRLTLNDRQDMPYDWTADNKSIIFVSDRTGIFSIYKQAIDQTMPELLLSADQPLSEPRLSPDGGQVVYVVFSATDNNSGVPLMVVPLAGGAARQIAKAKWIVNHQCARAPATICIYSTVTDSAMTFFRFDVAGGSGPQVYQVKDDLPQLFNWSLSPDGTMLAIAKGKMGGEEPRIHIVSLTGGREKWLNIQDWPGIAALDWAADSKSIWASTVGEKENVLLRIDLQGNARVVWRPKNIKVQWAIPSRDGKYVALHVDGGSANVWMLEH